MRRRWFIIVAWVIGSFLGWGLVCTIVFFTLMYAENERGMALPAWLITLYGIGSGPIGCVVVNVIVLVLAIMGRLPGTRPAIPHRRRGFSVEVEPRRGTP